MIQLEGIITTMSSLHIGKGKPKGTFVQTLDYIPGRTIRGMLGYYLYKNDMQLFKDIGIDEEDDISKMGIFFKNAYPIYDNDMTIASPLLFKWCKKCHTLFGMNDKECKKIKDDRQCLHEGKKHSGLISIESIKNKELKIVKSYSKQIETKCPITRAGHAGMGGADQGYELSPYYIESIPIGARFRLRIIVKNEFADKILTPLKNAGIFYGLGGFRSKGFGTIKFDITEKQDLDTKIKRRIEEISMMKSKLLIVNSHMILKKGEESIIGFDDTFKEYSTNTLKSLGIEGNVDIDPSYEKVSSSITGGWSIKNRNSIAELIRCIEPGSCIKVSGDDNALAILETYGIGNMINCGYGDVYIIGDIV